jgi:hypothetical protein
MAHPRLLRIVAIDGGAILQNLIAVIAGALGGVTTVVFTFKTRLALIEQKADNERGEAVRVRAEQTLRIDRILSRFASLDRRQLVMLQILSDVAQKVGADGRLSDLMVKFLSATGTPSGTDPHSIILDSGD